MLAVRMYANMSGFCGSQQVHSVSHHHRALVEMALHATLGFARSLFGRKDLGNQIVKVHSSAPVNLRIGPNGDGATGRSGPRRAPSAYADARRTRR